MSSTIIIIIFIFILAFFFVRTSKFLPQLMAFVRLFSFGLSILALVRNWDQTVVIFSNLSTHIGPVAKDIFNWIVDITINSADGIMDGLEELTKGGIQ